MSRFEALDILAKSETATMSKNSMTARTISPSRRCVIKVDCSGREIGDVRAVDLTVAEYGNGIAVNLFRLPAENGRARIVVSNVLLA